MIPWGATTVDLDADGRLDLLISHGPGIHRLSRRTASIGPQHTMAFWNAGDARFVDVTEALGLIEWGQWRLVQGDLDRDGRPDLSLELDETPVVPESGAVQWNSVAIACEAPQATTWGWEHGFESRTATELPDRFR